MDRIALRQPSSGRQTDQIIAQGAIEKAFVNWLVACTKRIEFDRAGRVNGQSRDPFYLLRGILAGQLAEHELQAIANDRGFTIALDTLIDSFIGRERRIRDLAPERQAELRSSVIAMIRSFQERFPSDDGQRDWLEVRSLLAPQTDLFVRRPGRFAIRVRPDSVVGIGDTIVCVEFSTARDPSAVSPARFALNHYAVQREQQRRPDWAGFTKIATRVERLALDDGFTVELTNDQAEAWRLEIGQVADAFIDGHSTLNQGPHCSTVPTHLAGMDSPQAFTNRRPPTWVDE